jgi:hypothetical protein
MSGLLRYSLSAGCVIAANDVADLWIFLKKFLKTLPQYERLFSLAACI